MRYNQKRVKSRAYTLIETLVASAVMMMAVGAASSLSLAMVTQEESAERAIRATNYLENAATLYQLGFESSKIQSILPAEPVVVSLSVSPVVENVPNLGVVNFAEMELIYRPSGAVSALGSDAGWTGGDNSVTRSHTIRVVRGEP